MLHPTLRRFLAGGLLVAMLASSGIAAWRMGGASTLTQLSRGLGGEPTNGAAGFPAISGTGRFVAFVADAGNLVEGDTNFQRDIFLGDRTLGTTTLVSASAAGEEGNDFSNSPAISGNGRFVAFESLATNLIAGDVNAARDVFVKDIVAGSVERVSVASDDTAANGPSFEPRISSGGSFVAFRSASSNLVASDTNGVDDVFLRDRDSATTDRVSVATNGAQGNGASDQADLSADGALVVFRSVASNLVSGDANGASDVFLRDLTAGTTTCLSAIGGVPSNGASRNPRITSDGRFVAFTTTATDLVDGDSDPGEDVVILDRTNGSIERVSVGLGGANPDHVCTLPALSTDGRFVAFASEAANLVEEDHNGREDVFLVDRTLGTTVRISISNGGAQGSGFASDASISDDGSVVAFMSDSDELDTEPLNGVVDVFAFDFSLGPPPDPEPFVSVDLFLLRGRISASGMPSKESFAVTGTYAFNELSVDGAIQPNHEAMTIRIGAAANPFVFTIPADDPGWTHSKADVWTWRTAPQASPRIFVKLFGKTRRYRIVGGRLDVPDLPTSEIAFRLQIGSDLGLVSGTWKSNKPKTVFTAKSLSG